jgi:phosphatidylinositol-3-phosphatase
VKLWQEPLRKAIAAAATLNGKSLALLIASSLVATSGIVASALSGSGGLGPVEAAAGVLLGEEPAVVASAPAPAAGSEVTPETTSSRSARPAGPVTAGDPPLPATAQEGVPPTAPPAGEESAEEPEAPVAEPEASEAGPIKHVFLISLASPGYEAAFGASSQMPYLSGALRPQGVLLSNYSLLDEAALANGFAAIGGQKPTAASGADCADYEKCLFPVETLTLADQLATGRFSWHAYLEGMADEAGKPANCVHPEPDAPEVPSPGGYAAKLNPFVFFHSLLDLGDCAANDVPLTELAKDLKKPNVTANFNYIAPDLCNAGFRGQCPEGTVDGAAAANAWLEKTVPEILSSPAYKKDGLLIVSFGALDPAPPADPTATPPADPLKVGALLVSPLLTPDGTDAAAYGPYSLLRSTEDLFGLEALGEAGGAKVRSFASAFVASETTAGD